MSTSEIVASSIAALSLIVSLIVAYKTLFARFSGHVAHATRLVLARLDDIPAIGLACFFQNNGARAGILEDLCLILTHPDSGATYRFFPQIIRKDYSIYRDYKEKDWFPFSNISLPPRYDLEAYILFKPLNDNFTPQKGRFLLELQSKWHGEDNWIMSPPNLDFILTEEISGIWNNPDHFALQVTCETLLNNRQKQLH